MEKATNINNASNRTKKHGKVQTMFNTLNKQKYLLLMALPAFLILLVFNYFPMYGIIIAFKDYKFGSVLNAPWVGFKWFIDFFTIPTSYRLIRNTFAIGLESLIWGFPAPIILALLLNEINCKSYKKVVQTVSYLPHFISTVILVGMLKQFCSLEGLFNAALSIFGQEPIRFFTEPSWFRTLFVGSGIWQGAGWGSIIYLASLSGVDVQLYEAATVDGANRWQKMLHVTLPALIPTIVIMLIMNMGTILNADYQKVLLMYNELTYDTADILSTYVYREGLEGGKYSYSSAVGLLTSVVSLVFIQITNHLSKRLTDESLW